MAWRPHTEKDGRTRPHPTRSRSRNIKASGGTERCAWGNTQAFIETPRGFTADRCTPHYGDSLDRCAEHDQPVRATRAPSIAGGDGLMVLCASIQGVSIVWSTPIGRE